MVLAEVEEGFHFAAGAGAEMRRDAAGGTESGAEGVERAEGGALYIQPKIGRLAREEGECGHGASIAVWDAESTGFMGECGSGIATVGST